MVSEDYPLRANWAFLRLQQLSLPERVSQGVLAERVGKRVGREFTQAAASRWLTNAPPRDLDTMDALAFELMCEPGWLYFNRGDRPGWEEKPDFPANAPGEQVRAPRLPRRRAETEAEKAAKKKARRRAS